MAEGSAAFIDEIIEQAQIAVAGADLIVLVVDAQTGVTAADEAIAEIMRRTDKPVLVAANKVDDIKQADEAYDFYGLGFSAVFGISAIHGLGAVDMLDEVVHALDTVAAELEDELDDDRLKIAIVGRPNAGKSTLLNRLIGEDRAIVSEVAGTTRDAIDSEIAWYGEPLL